MKLGRVQFTPRFYFDDGGAGGAGGGTGGSGGGTGDTDLISRAEAKKAFEARDAAKRELRALQESGRVLTEEQLDKYRKLEELAAKAEEDAKKKAGEWDSLRESLTKKHATELDTERQRVSAAEQEVRDLLVETAFANATDLFGPSAKTIYNNARTAQRVFREYVDVEQYTDGAGKSRRRVIVRDVGGNVIVDAKTGQPASFAVAIGELIDSLPDKNDHLRGSGKTGSGSSGGSTGSTQPVDLRNLNPANLTAEQRAALLAQRGSGGIVMGAAYQK